MNAACTLVLSSSASVHQGCKGQDDSDILSLNHFQRNNQHFASAVGLIIFRVLRYLVNICYVTHHVIICTRFPVFMLHLKCAISPSLPVSSLPM